MDAGRFNPSVLQNMTTLAQGAAASAKTVQQGQQQIKKAMDNKAQQTKGAQTSEEAQKQKELEKQKKKQEAEEAKLGKERFAQTKEEEIKDKNMRQADLLREQAKLRERELAMLKGGSGETRTKERPLDKKPPTGGTKLPEEKKAIGYKQVPTTYQATAEEALKAAKTGGAASGAGVSDAELAGKGKKPEGSGKTSKNVLTSSTTPTGGQKISKGPKKGSTNSDIVTNREVATRAETESLLNRLGTELVDVQGETETSKELKDTEGDEARILQELKRQKELQEGTVTDKKDRDHKDQSFSGEEKGLTVEQVKHVRKMKRATRAQEIADAEKGVKDFQTKTGISTPALSQAKEMSMAITEDPKSTEKHISTKKVDSKKPITAIASAAPIVDVMPPNLPPVAVIPGADGKEELIETKLPEKKKEVPLQEETPVAEKTAASATQETIQAKSKTKEAMLCYDKAATLDPENRTILSTRGYALERIGKKEEAEKCFAEVDRIDNQRIKQAQEEQLRKAEAKLIQNPEDTEALCSKIHYMGQLGKKEEALALCDKILESNPKDSDILYEKVQILYDMGREEESHKLYKEFKELNKEQFLISQQTIISEADKALEKNPNDTEALTNKAGALRRMDKSEEALACYDKAIEIEPDNPRLWDDKASYLRALGKDSDAIACLNAALEFNPNDMYLWMQKGDALSKTGNYIEASECYVLARNIKINESQNWNTKGLQLLKEGNYDEALKCFDKAIGLDPNNSDAYYQKASLLHNKGKFADAVPFYDYALGLNPKNVDAWFGKGIALSGDKNKANEALAAFDNVLYYNPYHAGAWNEKGVLLQNLGRYADAEHCFKNAKLCKEGKFNPQTMYNPGYGYNNATQPMMSSSYAMNQMAINNFLMRESFISSMGLMSASMGAFGSPFMCFGGMGMGLDMGIGMGLMFLMGMGMFSYF
ncbi:MAG: lipoprotein NlpI [bacterium ADurb.Bin363]|nr:MAG: lipoprotein NlpI [bacterium ADurb.Bin363]